MDNSRRYDPKAGRWRGAGGRFMKGGAAMWILVECEGCGLPFSTKRWHQSEQAPDHFFCALCWARRWLNRHRRAVTWRGMKWTKVAR